MQANFRAVWSRLIEEMKNAPAVAVERWQGVDVSKNPAALTYELLFENFEVDLLGIEDLDYWRKDIGPNLPFADQHFEERVCGSPLNPGEAWKVWPWAGSAAKFRGADELFNHTYSERLWPKWPRHGDGGMYPDKVGIRRVPRIASIGMRGIAQIYGDLEDLVNLLALEPHTRQAYIPLFFPEDTGFGDGGRKPCTLGYQFIVREKQLSIFYPMRSVDLRRHFRDDCYLAVRLLLWVLDRCREVERDFWKEVKPGIYSMAITSLHCFANDHAMLRRGEDW